MPPHLQRALLLFDQGRLELAERELRLALAAEPAAPHARALLALCLLQREDYAGATAEAEGAVGLAPDFPFAHYVLGRVFLGRNRPREALAAATEAVRLDPTDADYCLLLARIHFHESAWAAALDAARRGLEQEPEHVGCTNLEAMALVKLGRPAEAGRTIQRALAREPDNSLTHANQGWTCLEARQPKQALEHFRESLRLDPQNEWARHGIVEALKAQHFLYAWMLRYFLAMAKLRDRAQWGIILGAYFGNQMLGGLARSHPGLAPWIQPVRILYLVFVLLTWLSSPLFNLVLRLNRFGRLALAEEETVASNWLGAFLAGALLAFAGYLVTDRESLLVLAGVAAFLVLPLTGVFKVTSGWPRWVMIAYTVFTGGLGLAAVGVAEYFLHSDPHQARAGLQLFSDLIGTFVVAVLASTWVLNLLGLYRRRH